jgi:transposase
MTVGRDTLSKAETVTVAAVEVGVPTLVEAREIIAHFHGMIRRRAAAELSSWIERARASLVASFARGVTNDEAAVRAAITSPWSNPSQTRQTSNVRPRQNRFASGQADRRSMKSAAPRVRQSQFWTPIDTIEFIAQYRFSGAGICRRRR